MDSNISAPAYARVSMFHQVGAEDIGRGKNISMGGLKTGSDILADALEEEEVARELVKFSTPSPKTDADG